MAKKYNPRKGCHLSKEQAQRYGSRIAELMKTGKVTASDVLTDAKRRSSPLNGFFEWDDSVAGEKYRSKQATYLLTNIVEVVEVEGVRTPVRSFFSVNQEPRKEGVYVTVKEATTKPKYRTELLERIITHLENTTSLMKLFQYYEK
ncbi:MAG: hypothetical protein CL811_10540 [Colwelliaceae bacterium]|nr:hypothetical protein [Colwelliaceae bacterium]